MASGSAKEMREGMTGVKRAAEWDPPQRCGKNPRQATTGGELVVSSSSAANHSEYCPAMFIHAPSEACHAFDFSSFTYALQSEVFIGGTWF
ncbi:hypothetical protein PVAP13_5KG421163 [Panicum virgatum]|uniref:Uncharacterized protein n=1 Tax=Panicum virgatum TaxID=38727 RepID=A0A8T0SRA5_PANVG|nr:hypothetical protein PVAP13_5KG421163 [Panicum virgatum]